MWVASIFFLLKQAKKIDQRLPLPAHPIATSFDDGYEEALPA